jgi:alpha-D-ribose 1-methylphosphonate 5-triphosphate synthase subunit PhnL
MNQQAVLKIEGYAKQFNLHEQGKVIPSSHAVDLEVYSGELTALTGPTGAGKSSVLKGVYRTYLPSAGKLLYRSEEGEELDLAAIDEYRVLELRRNELAFVTQFLHFLPRQATEDVVAQPLVQRGMEKGEAKGEAHRLLAAMNLPERLWGISPATFSGGEKQRVNLARGLIAKPRLLLLDEPTASLDARTADQVLLLIDELKKEGVAMLAIFHDTEQVRRIADRTVEIVPPASVSTPLEDIA